MRSVRCDACGTKALMAASQCPKCGHLFEVRDGFGELLPLSHCASCDAYYPAHVHTCKWCGTALTPEKARKSGSDRLRWIAAGTFGVAVVLGLLARDPGPKTAARPRPSDQSNTKPTAPAETLARVTPAVYDTVNSGEVVGVDRDVPAEAAEPRTASAAVTRARHASSPWVSMIAKRWVIVRTGADRTAHVVASVGPNSRVQLGEARGSWRRIKLRGIAGWVDASEGSFVASRSSAQRARRVADR